MSRPTVYFGFETALRILRAVDPGKLVKAKGAARMLPERPPGKRDVEGALEQIASLCPGAELGKRVHVLVGGTAACRPSSLFQAHSCTSKLVGTCFYRLTEDVCACTPPLALAHLAPHQKTLASLLELLWEACGSYQTTRTAAASAYGLAPMTTAKKIGSFVKNNPSVHGSGKTAAALRYLADNSASPRETKQALILGLPMRYGGYATGIPCMNHKVAATPAARAITGKSFFRCDLCWPEAKLDVEYQSRESHEGEASRISDSRRANALASMGWTVLGITNDELDSMAATDTIARSIYDHLGRRFQVTSPDHRARKVRLRIQLGLPVNHE